MAESEQIGGASVSVTADTTPILQELEKMRQGVESRINALGVAMTGPIYIAIRGLQSAFHGLQSVIMAPFHAMSGILNSVFGPMHEAMSKSLLDIDHWTAKAREMEVNQVRFNAVFQASGNVIGYTAKELENMRKYMSEATGFSGGAIRQAQQNLIQLHDVRGENFFKALEVSANLAARSTGDLAEAANMVGRALVNPEHGMRQLRHAGVMFTDAEKKMIEVAGAGGDVFAQQAVMLDILKNKIGEVAAAMATTADSKIRRLATAWSELGTTLWKFLAPLQGAVAEIASTIVRAFSSVIGPTFEDFTKKTEGWAKAVTAFLKENKQTFMTWAELGRQIVGNLVQFVADALSKLFGGQQKLTVTDYWDRARDGITKFLSLVSVLTSNFQKFWDVFKLEMRVMWEDFKVVALQAWNELAVRLVPVFSKIGEIFGTIIRNALLKAVEPLYMMMVNMVEWFNEGNLRFAGGDPTKAVDIAQSMRQSFRNLYATTPSLTIGSGAGANTATAGLDELRARARAAADKAQAAALEKISDTSRDKFADQRKGSPDYNRLVGQGGIVGIEQYSRQVTEALLQKDFAKETADNTKAAAEAAQAILGKMLGAAAGPNSSMAVAAAVFAAPA